VWIDEGELVIGDSLVRRIAAAIHETGYLVALVSSSSIDSGWCQKDLSLAVSRGIKEVRQLVLPVRVGEIAMPTEQ
jgi:TIR domain